MDNRIAAQLKFINKTGQEETCYVFRNQEKFSFDEDIEKQGASLRCGIHKSWYLRWRETNEHVIYSMAPFTTRDGKMI